MSSSTATVREVVSRRACPARSETVPFAWQGWQTHLPSSWQLTELDGDHHTGHAIFTEAHRPRLLLHWSASRRSRRKPSSDQPVWTHTSPHSARTIAAILDAAAGELPIITDTPPSVPAPWSVFNLHCTVPPGFTLRTHTFNPGDLSLHFTARRPSRSLTLRQLTPARLALARAPLSDWLARNQGAAHQYRPAPACIPVELRPDLTGLSRKSTRRRRFFFARHLPPELITYALHDVARDRLVIVQGSDEPLVRQAAESVGRPPEAPL